MATRQRGNGEGTIYKHDDGRRQTVLTPTTIAALRAHRAPTVRSGLSLAAMGKTTGSCSAHTPVVISRARIWVWRTCAS